MKIFSVLFLLVIPPSSAFTPSFAHTKKKSKHSTSAIFNAADFKVAYDLNPRNTFLLDIREPDEWAEAHLSIATPNPLTVLSSGKWMDTTTGKYYPGTFPIDRFTGVSIVKNAKIYVHCKMGDRAKEGVEMLEQMGYSEVVALAETFDELVAAQLCDIISGEVQSLTDGWIVYYRSLVLCLLSQTISDSSQGMLPFNWTN